MIVKSSETFIWSSSGDRKPGQTWSRHLANNVRWGEARHLAHWLLSYVSHVSHPLPRVCPAFYYRQHQHTAACRPVLGGMELDWVSNITVPAPHIVAMPKKDHFIILPIKAECRLDQWYRVMWRWGGEISNRVPPFEHWHFRKAATTALFSKKKRRKDCFVYLFLKLGCVSGDPSPVWVPVFSSIYIEVIIFGSISNYKLQPVETTCGDKHCNIRWRHPISET